MRISCLSEKPGAGSKASSGPYFLSRSSNERTSFILSIRGLLAADQDLLKQLLTFTFVKAVTN